MAKMLISHSILIWLFSAFAYSIRQTLITFEPPDGFNDLKRNSEYNLISYTTKLIILYFEDI